MTRRGHDRGQATVELALALPVLLVVLLGVVQVAVVVRDRLAVQLPPGRRLGRRSCRPTPRRLALPPDGRRH